MSQLYPQEKIYIGADISKATIDIFNNQTGEFCTINNDKAAIKRFLKSVKVPATIVFEATGGYERKLSDLLENHPMLTRLRVHPACVKAFARALGSKAKTDKIDAYMLAKAAQTMPETFVDTTPSAHIQDLRDMLTYQKQLEAMRHNEKCRLKMDDITPMVLKQIQQHIAFIDKQITKIQADILKLIKQDASLSRQYTDLQKVCGVGPAIALCIIAFLPELGRIDRRQVASLAGLAPRTRQSGTKTGRAFTQGGRKALRQALYMGALVGVRHNPVLKDFYTRLVENGRPKMVALIATTRKLLIHLNANEKRYLQSNAKTNINH